MNIVWFVLALIAGLLAKDLIVERVAKPVYRLVLVLVLIVVVILLRQSGIL
jgi:branched-subunit amino acid ABC-type transport system permease component